MEQQSERVVPSAHEVYQKATIYVAMYKAFQEHMKTCDKCKTQMPTSMLHCSVGFFSGLNVKNAHEALIGSL